MYPISLLRAASDFLLSPYKSSTVSTVYMEYPNPGNPLTIPLPYPNKYSNITPCRCDEAGGPPARTARIRPIGGGWEAPPCFISRYPHALTFRPLQAQYPISDPDRSKDRRGPLFLACGSPKSARKTPFAPSSIHNYGGAVEGQSFSTNALVWPLLILHPYQPRGRVPVEYRRSFSLCVHPRRSNPSAHIRVLLYFPLWGRH